MRPPASTCRPVRVRRRRVRTSVFAAVKISATGSTWGSRPRRRSRWAVSRRSALRQQRPLRRLAEQRRLDRRALGRGRPRHLGSAVQPEPDPGRGACGVRERVDQHVGGSARGRCSTSAGGTQSGQDFGQQCPGGVAGTPSFGNGSPATCFAMATSFHRRQSNQIWYQSPTFAGFRGRVSYGATSGATSNATNDGANLPSTVKPQLWGASVSYTLGGLYAGVGWEKHDDYITTAARYHPRRIHPRRSARGRHDGRIHDRSDPDRYSRRPTASAATIPRVGTSTCATRSGSVSRSVVTTKPSSGT